MIFDSIFQKTSTLDFILNKPFPADDRDRLRLHVCGDALDLVNAEEFFDGNAYTWDPTDFPWSTGITVSLALSATASSDATLSALTLSDGMLSPSFASNVTDYTASAANAASRITVTAARSDSTADIDYLDGDGDELTDLDPGTDGHQVDLVVGENVIQVKLTAEDGTTTKTYKVTVTRAAQSRHRRDPERSHAEQGHAEPVLRLRCDRLRGVGGGFGLADHGDGGQEGLRRRHRLPGRRRH